MRELRPLLDEAPRLFKGIAVIYDAEAIFALREILEEELAGNTLTVAERKQRIRKEVDLCRGVQRVISVSEPEASVFRRHGYPASVVGHAAIITDNNVSHAEWEIRRDVVFVGAIHGDGGPNYETVVWFLDKIWPALARRLPESRFVIAGLNRSRRLTEEPLPDRVRVTNELEDLSPVYASARVFVAPTRASAGIPLKIIEAAGWGVPVVATSLLVGQLKWRSPDEIIAADTPDEFVESCVRLFENRGLWEDQRRAALLRVGKEYSQETFSQQLFEALNVRPVGRPARG
jgi:glycosyltransferase involved in cell wall biosynthesis